MPLFETSPVGLQNYVRVKNEEPFITLFNDLACYQSEVLYNHSRIFPFAYLNKGRMQLYLNKDLNERKIIPVVRKHEQKPEYTIYSPYCDIQELLIEVVRLDPFSSEPVCITDVTRHFADKFLEQVKGWEKVKTSDDVIQQADLLAKLAGRNFSSLRNTMKHVRNDLKPETQALNARNANDAICVFERWKTLSAQKYFRITIGRDIRLVEEYCDKLDFENFFAYVHYINNVPSAVSFGTRSVKDRTWGQDITCKALPTCKGLADFAFIHLCTEMNKKGITLINDSGGQGKVMLNKKKFSPLMTIPQYDLRRK